MNNDILRNKANRKMINNSFYLDYDLRKKYDSLDELYDEFLSKQDDDSSFYYFDDNKIICIDTLANDSDKYWVEEFPLEDYEYADKWLCYEIEMKDYYEAKNKDREV